MTQRVRSQTHADVTFGSGSQNDIFMVPGDSEGTVMVSHGPYMERLPVGNMTVSEIRMRFSDRLDIDPQSQAVLDGQEVAEDTRVTIGQALAFVRKAGEKGTLA